MNKTTSCMMALLTVSAFCGGRTLAGTLDAPAAVNSSTSAMWTLNDIYNVLDTRTTNVTRRTTVFTEPTNGPTVGTMHNLNDIMALVTNRAAVAKTGQTPTVPTVSSPTPGMDGNLRIGVSWPNPRFTPLAASGDLANQIRDNLTGLIWARHANLASNSSWTTTGICTWTNAFDIITNSAGFFNAVNYGGTNDWRMPNYFEMLSVLCMKYANPTLSDATGTNQWSEARGPFTGIFPGYYWTSTTNPYNSAQRMGVSLSVGSSLADRAYNSAVCYLWPVRGGK